MSQVPANIFRKYDIRGTVRGDAPQLTTNVAMLVGKGYGTYMQRTFQTDHVFIGSDNRLSSPPLKKAVIEGLVSTGLHVTEIGEVMTPTVYFASAQYGPTGGGIQVTGSHLALDYNGIKMSYGKLALADEQIQAILQLILTDDFESGIGYSDSDHDMVNKHMDAIAALVKLGPRKLKIVVDAGNGISGPYMPPVYEKLGVKADLGIAFDGDADRCGIIDDHGHHIAADRLLALLARDMLTRHPGAKVVFDVKSSQALFDEIKAHGGIPMMWKSGHSLMKAKIAEEGALLGGEVSGHLFIGEDYYGFDDAGLVSLKIIEILSKTQQTVTELFDDIPKLVATPEIIISAPDNIKFDVINGIQKKLEQNYSVNDVDGARAAFPDGWGLVRASNTQPAITLRFEAHTKAQVVDYMKIFNGLLAAYPQVDRTELEKQIAAFQE